MIEHSAIEKALEILYAELGKERIRVKHLEEVAASAPVENTEMYERTQIRAKATAHALSEFEQGIALLVESTKVKSRVDYSKYPNAQAKSRARREQLKRLDDKYES